MAAGTGRGRKCRSWWGAEALFPLLELAEGKIVCDDAASSHLLVCKHGAGTVEWKAVLPGARSPGVSRHAAGLHIPPSRALDREAPPALEDSSL